MIRDEGECDVLIEQRGLLCQTGQELCVFDRRARYFLAVRRRASSRNRTEHLPHTKVGVAPCNSRGRNRQTQPYGWSDICYAKKSKCDGTAHLRGIKKWETNPTEAGRSPKGRGCSRMRAMRECRCRTICSGQFDNQSRLMTFMVCASSTTGVEDERLPR